MILDNSRVAVSNDSVETDLMQVRGFELQHLIDTCSVYLIGSFFNCDGSTIGPAKRRVDQLFAELVEQIKGGKVSAARDLDELSKAIADLSDR